MKNNVTAARYLIGKSVLSRALDARRTMVIAALAAATTVAICAVYYIKYNDATMRFVINRHPQFSAVDLRMHFKSTGYAFSHLGSSRTSWEIDANSADIDRAPRKLEDIVIASQFGWPLKWLALQHEESYNARMRMNGTQSVVVSQQWRVSWHLLLQCYLLHCLAFASMSCAHACATLCSRRRRRLCIWCAYPVAELKQCSECGKIVH